MTGGRNVALVAVVAGAAAAVGAGMLGVASGEGPAVTGRTLSVQGVGVVPIGVRDDAATATSTYREGAAKALADAQAKATFLAGKAGVSIAAVQSLAEEGGYIECSSPTSEYAEYEGQQPDFGFATAPTVVGVAGAPAPAAKSLSRSGPQVSHRPKVKKKKKPTAKKATATSCNLTAQVSVLYALG